MLMDFSGIDIDALSQISQYKALMEKKQADKLRQDKEEMGSMDNDALENYLLNYQNSPYYNPEVGKALQGVIDTTNAAAEAKKVSDALAEKNDPWNSYIPYGMDYNTMSIYFMGEKLNEIYSRYWKSGRGSIFDNYMTPEQQAKMTPIQKAFGSDASWTPSSVSWDTSRMFNQYGFGNIAKPDDKTLASIINNPKAQGQLIGFEGGQPVYAGGFSNTYTSGIAASVNPDGTISYHYVPQKVDEGNGLLGGIASVLTGGLSDIVQGNPWGSGQINAIDSLLGDSNMIGHGLSNLINPIGKQIKDLKQTWDSDASFIDKFSTAFERVADPTRSVNYSLGQSGRILPDSVLDIAPAIGATIGTYIYPVAGTAIGYGIGSHLGDDRNDGNSDSTKALTGAGLSATAAYAAGAEGGSLSDLLMSAAKIGGKALVSELLSPNGSRPASSKYAGAISQNAPQAGIDSTQANTIAQTIENATYPQAQATPSQLPLEGYSKFDRALTPYNLRKRRKLIEDDLYPYIA